MRQKKRVAIITGGEQWPGEGAAIPIGGRWCTG